MDPAQRIPAVGFSIGRKLVGVFGQELVLTSTTHGRSGESLSVRIAGTFRDAGPVHRPPLRPAPEGFDLAAVLRAPADDVRVPGRATDRAGQRFHVSRRPSPVEVIE